jgi:hypothetical protein
LGPFPLGVGSSVEEALGEGVGEEVGLAVAVAVGEGVGEGVWVELIPISTSWIVWFPSGISKSTIELAATVVAIRFPSRRI